MSIPEINALHLAQTLQQVVQSFSSQSTEFKGHKYVKIDAKTKQIDFTSNKNEAASFKELTKLVKLTFFNENISSSTKFNILKNYKKIAEKFENKRLGFFAKIFYYFQKSGQVQKAKDMLQSEFIKLFSAKENFIAALDSQKILETPQAAENLTFVECQALYKKLALKNHPDKNSGNTEAAERFKMLGNAWEDFKKAMSLGKDVDVNQTFLREVDKKYSLTSTPKS